MFCIIWQWTNNLLPNDIVIMELIQPRDQFHKMGRNVVRMTERAFPRQFDVLPCTVQTCRSDYLEDKQVNSL